MRTKDLGLIFVQFQSVPDTSISKNSLKNHTSGPDFWLELFPRSEIIGNNASEYSIPPGSAMHQRHPDIWLWINTY
jgi:hypothetical protein